MSLSKGPKTFLVTGGNRGLGLEIVKQVVTKYSPDFVFPTFRDATKAQELMEFAKLNPCVHPVKMDVEKPETYDAAFEKVKTKVGERGLDVLMNNAGVFINDSQDFETISRSLIMQLMEVNTFGPLFVTKAFAPLLELAGKNPTGYGKAVVFTFSSKLGSMDDNKSGGYYASRCTRAASNSITKSLSIDLKPRNILVAAINPGWVQTDQGGPKAPLTPYQSVSGILNILDNFTESQTGAFLQYDGQIIPW